MSKIKLCMVTFGIIIGIVGILHGSAELLQGSLIVESQSVEALPKDWPNKEFHTMTHGSPVFSVLTGIPYYVLGLLAITVSSTLITLSATLIQKTRLSLGLIVFALCSVGIFLFGAGRGTPVAISVPVVFFGVLSLTLKQNKERSDTSKKVILSSFYFFYGLHVFSWILFFPGLFVYSFYAEISQGLFLFAFMSMPIAILGALISGLLYDKTLHPQMDIQNA